MPIKIVRLLANSGSRLKGATVSGTTSVTAHTSTLHAHGLSTTPTTAVVTAGNAYVVGVDATNVEVRSAGLSQAFTVRVCE